MLHQDGSPCLTGQDPIDNEPVPTFTRARLKALFVEPRRDAVETHTLGTKDFHALDGDLLALIAWPKT